ncbi:MAG: NAD(+) synthase [Bacteroidaceae bacterium]|nr:NAD(+) synthase [Bacteroidaceae bacterium]
MQYGFVKVASAIPHVRVGNCQYNRQQIENLVRKAAEQEAEIVCFPELSLTAYTCQDLFGQQSLLDEAERQLGILLENTRELPTVAIVGLPVAHRGKLLNCAAVLQGGRLLAVVPKSYLPNYREFYEMRWFAPGLDVPCEDILLCGQRTRLGNKVLFQGDFTFGVEVCEDVWAPIPPSSQLCLQGADVIFNLSADNDAVGKHEYLKKLLSQQSARCLCGYVFSGCGFGESTQDVVFSGKAFVYEDGHLLAEADRFSLDEQLVVSEIDVERLRSERRVNTTFSSSAVQCQRNADYEVVQWASAARSGLSTLARAVDAHPFVPSGPALGERCEEIFNIQVEGLAKRMLHTHSKTAVVGISGGLDSTLALLVAVRTFDRLGMERKGIQGITMPGFGTTDRTYNNAIRLMEELGVTICEINIKEACLQHFRDIGHAASVHDVTYENSQARERTQVLMDVANQCGGIVVGTGDLSELALGWATYNGDHMSMYGVNASVPKTLVRHLVVWSAHQMPEGVCRATLLDIAATPISPELVPADSEGNIAQKTEDLVGPYELHDFFLYYFLRFGFAPAKVFFLSQVAFKDKYDKATIKKWLTTFCRRFFQQQFKRSCLPDGPKVGSCSLSPRGDWRMPSDADASLWLEECERL